MLIRTAKPTIRQRREEQLSEEEMRYINALMRVHGSIRATREESGLHHALEPVTAASIEQFAVKVDDKFGFRPPVAELLSKDVSGQLLLNVTSAKVTGREKVGWTTCVRLNFVQPGMTGDLWVGVKDGLPAAIS